MKKLKLYIETTIPNFVFNDDIPDKQESAKILFDEIKENKYDAYISQVVTDEIDDAPEPKRSKMLELVDSLSILPVTEECQNLAEEYLNRKVIPKKNMEDALHIAVASVYEVDALVSYNFEHIVKLKTKREITAINLTIGYRYTPDFVTPEEVIEYGKV